MELLTQLLQALWAQDFETLANPSMIGMLYFVLFVILFLENGLLPAAFLPGDSAADRCLQPRLLGQLYSGAMAGQYPHRTKLAISFTRALSSTRTPSFS